MFRFTQNRLTVFPGRIIRVNGSTCITPSGILREFKKVFLLRNIQELEKFLYHLKIYRCKNVIIRHYLQRHLKSGFRCLCSLVTYIPILQTSINIKACGDPFFKLDVRISCFLDKREFGGENNHSMSPNPHCVTLQ